MFHKGNFFRELEFYKKESIPDDIFKGLAYFINNPLFTYENMCRYSKASAALCLWVRAVYKYADIYRNMAPKLKELEAAEEEMKKVPFLLSKCGNIY